MPRWFGNSLKWAAGIGTSVLAACSIHPIPDNVSHYDTAEIVKNVRCEAKAGVSRRIRQALDERNIMDVAPEDVLRNPVARAKVRRRDPGLAATFEAFGVSTITYTFTFNITEQNNTSGVANFLMPFSGGGGFTLATDGQFDKTRQGIREFTMVESFDRLADLKCDGWEQPHRNPLYPMTGSIGVDDLVTTFINVSIMGALDPARLPKDEKSFTDTIKFTTTIGSSVNPTLKMDPLPNRFRPTEASITRGDSRVDVHQVVIALLFPDLHAVRHAALTGTLRELARANEAQALENNCVAVERAREDRFGTLRRRPPAIYCRKGDEALAPPDPN